MFGEKIFKILKQDKHDIRNQREVGFYWEKAIATIGDKHSKLYGNIWMERKRCPRGPCRILAYSPASGT